MRRVLGLGLAALALAACAPVLSTPTPTATATPSPTAMPTFTVTPTPPPSPAAVPGDAFAAFAQGIAAAVERGDAAAIVSATVPTLVDCRGLTEETPWCLKENLGQVLSGVKVGPWRSEYTLFSQHDYQNLLERFFAEAQTQTTDQYGSGKPALAAIGNPDGEERDLVVTALTPRGREALLLRFRAQGGRWGIEGVIVVGAPFVGEVLPPGKGHYLTKPWPGG